MKPAERRYEFLVSSRVAVAFAAVWRLAFDGERARPNRAAFLASNPT